MKMTSREVQDLSIVSMLTSESSRKPQNLEELKVSQK